MVFPDASLYGLGASGNCANSFLRRSLKFVISGIVGSALVTVGADSGVSIIGCFSGVSATAGAATSILTSFVFVCSTCVPVFKLGFPLMYL